MTQNKPFVDFVLKIGSETAEVTDLLNDPLSDNPSKMDEQVRAVEAWYGRLTTHLAHANYYLDIAQRDTLKPKEPGKTDLDRQIESNAAVANERRLRDILTGMTEAVRQRVILAQALMKAHSQEGRMQ